MKVQPHPSAEGSHPLVLSVGHIQEASGSLDPVLQSCGIGLFIPQIPHDSEEAQLVVHSWRHNRDCPEPSV